MKFSRRPKIELQFEIDHLPLAQAVQEFERQYIMRLIEENHGHRGKTAAMLDIDRKTLYRKLKQYDMSEGDGIKGRG